MNDDQVTKPAAVVMRFPSPAPAPTAAAATVDATPESFNKSLLVSLAAGGLAPALHEADCLVAQACGDVPVFGMLSVGQRNTIYERAAIAVNLGDPLKRLVADEKAALAIVREIDRGLRAGTISRTSPLAALDLTSARVVVAKLALEGGLGFLAGTTAK